MNFVHLAWCGITSETCIMLSYIGSENIVITMLVKENIKRILEQFGPMLGTQIYCNITGLIVLQFSLKANKEV